MLPVEHFSSLVVLLVRLYPAVFRLHKSVPFSPVRVFNFDISILVSISLFKTNELIEIG